MIHLPSRVGRVRCITCGKYIVRTRICRLTPCDFAVILHQKIVACFLCDQTYICSSVLWRRLKLLIDVWERKYLANELIPLVFYSVWLSYSPLSAKYSVWLLILLVALLHWRRKYSCNLNDRPAWLLKFNLFFFNWHLFPDYSGQRLQFVISFW